MNAIVHIADEKIELNQDCDVEPGLCGNPVASSVTILSFLNIYFPDVYVKSTPYETYGDYKPVELTKKRRACRDESSVNRNMNSNEVNR